jgi:predicted PurR-regulated permease PerM
MEIKKNSISSLMGVLIVLSVIVVVLLFLFFDQRKQSRNIIAQLEEYSELVTSKKDSLEV